MGPEHRKPRPRDAEAELLGEGRRAGEIGLRREQRELLAAVAREEVAVAELFQHQAGDLLEHRVPGRVSELVVQALEVVDVDEGEGEGLVGAVGALRLPGELVLEMAVVVEPREAVGEGELREHLVGPAQRFVLGAEPPVGFLDGGAVALELAAALAEALREIVEGAGRGTQQQQTEHEAHRRGEHPGADVHREVAHQQVPPGRRCGLEHPQRVAGRDRHGDGGGQRRPQQDEPDPEREGPGTRGRLRMHLSSSREGGTSHTPIESAGRPSVLDEIPGGRISCANIGNWKPNSAPATLIFPMARELDEAPVTLKSGDLSRMSANERIKVESKGLFYVADRAGTHSFRDELDALARGEPTISGTAKELSKFFGIYKQQGRGARGKKTDDYFFMVRIKLPVGRAPRRRPVGRARRRRRPLRRRHAAHHLAPGHPVPPRLRAGARAPRAPPEPPLPRRGDALAPAAT